MIYYRHKKTAEIVSEAEFEDKYIMPKAEEYFTYDDILMDFMNKSKKSYLPDWSALKKLFGNIVMMIAWTHYYMNGKK